MVLQHGPLQLRAAVLDHGTPCLGFVLQEAMHLNVWRTRLAERRLPTGPWLAELKAAWRRPAGPPSDRGLCPRAEAREAPGCRSARCAS